MDNATVQRRAAANAVSVVVRGILQAASIVLLTPMLVHYLGAHGFGLWSILYAFIPYATLFDFGISSALAKHLAELDYASEAEVVSEYVSSAALALAVGLALLSLALLALHGVTPLAAAAFQEADLSLCLLLFATALIANLSNYALVGLHRQDLASYIGAGFVIANAAGTAILLTHGGQLHALILFNVVTCIATAIVCTAFFYKLSKAAFVFRLHRLRIGRLLRTGWALQLYGVAALFYLYLGKWIVAFEISVAAVAAFEVALRALVVLKQGFSSVASPLMAAASRLTVTSQEASRALFQNSFRYFTMLAVPAFTAAAVFAPKLILLWIGPGHAESATVLALLAPGFLFGTLSGVVWFVLVGAGKSDFGVRVAVLEVVGGLVLCWLLTRRFGLVGSAAGLTIPGVLAMFGYLFVGKKALGISISACMFQLCRALLISLALIGSTAFMISRVESRPWIAAAILSSTALTYAALALIVTSSGERSAALQLFRQPADHGIAVNV